MNGEEKPVGSRAVAEDRQAMPCSRCPAKALLRLPSSVLPTLTVRFHWRACLPIRRPALFARDVDPVWEAVGHSASRTVASVKPPRLDRGQAITGLARERPKREWFRRRRQRAFRVSFWRYWPFSHCALEQPGRVKLHEVFDPRGV